MLCDLWYYDSNFTETCFYGFKWQYVNISSGNGLAPDWPQAIIWTNDGQFTDTIMCHSASISLLAIIPQVQCI